MSTSNSLNQEYDFSYLQNVRNALSLGQPVINERATLDVQQPLEKYQLSFGDQAEIQQRFPIKQQKQIQTVGHQATTPGNIIHNTLSKSCDENNKVSMSLANQLAPRKIIYGFGQYEKESSPLIINGSKYGIFQQDSCLEVQHDSKVYPSRPFEISNDYLDQLKNGPKQIAEPKYDLTLGLKLEGQKEKDFFKFFFSNNSTEMNLSTPQRIALYSAIQKADGDDEILVKAFSKVASQKMTYASGDQNKQRANNYRGVSKNGKLWQVLIMSQKRKVYIGSYDNEKDAAYNYDKAALLTHGLKAKTNFSYTRQELIQILRNQQIKFNLYI